MEQGDICSLRNNLTRDKSWYKRRTKVGKESILGVACREGYVAIIDFLLKNDPDITNAVVYKNERSLQPVILLFAPELQRRAIHSDRRRNLYFLEPGGDTARTTIMNFLINSGALLSAVDQEGNTPLHLAVRFGWAEMLRLLLDKCDPDLIDVTNHDGMTALELADVIGFARGIELIEIATGTADEDIMAEYEAELEAEQLALEEDEALRLGNPMLVAVARAKRAKLAADAELNKGRAMGGGGGASVPGGGNSVLEMQMRKAALKQVEAEKKAAEEEEYRQQQAAAKERERIEALKAQYEAQGLIFNFEVGDDGKLDAPPPPGEEKPKVRCCVVLCALYMARRMRKASCVIKSVIDTSV